eukprot:CAMPEP_0119433682 /NCGR_PEP_ID=MMETSP1335-20130426/50027_1 /TAXON_ID=259385 /ORGANISM="Chrysoculter rhomboideus, Strain RCC1486" /LENGTH=195 /DNA_ID=CAMNT_0007459527 /DNA_START=34 /DNA_END=621 /DNA_ORIENTATION=+
MVCVSRWGDAFDPKRFASGCDCLECGTPGVGPKGLRDVICVDVSEAHLGGEALVAVVATEPVLDEYGTRRRKDGVRQAGAMQAQDHGSLCEGAHLLSKCHRRELHDPEGDPVRCERLFCIREEGRRQVATCSACVAVHRPLALILAPPNRAGIALLVRVRAAHDEHVEVVPRSVGSSSEFVPVGAHVVEPLDRLV